MTLFKVLPIVELLASLGSENNAARRGGAKAERLVGFGIVALFFSLGGDFYLALDDYTSRDFFKTGLASFLISHIFYAVAFGFTPLDAKAGGIIVGASLILSRLLIMPHVEADLSQSIYLYIFVLAVMVWRAAAFCRDSTRHGVFEPALGGILFLVSDLLLAFNKFVRHVPAAGIWIMGTYYLSQFYLVKGLLRGARGWAKSRQ